MSRVMISYRRLDSAGITGRIFDRLAAHFGADSVFIDIDAIPFGADFRKYIESALKTIDHLVVIIGPRWLGPLPGGTMRIDDPADPVRLELETALRNEMRILPVLVDGARMPAPEALPESLQRVSLLNAAALDSGIDFQVHVERLIRSIEGTARPHDASGDFVPERSRDNLPKRLTPLIGRESALAAIESLVQTAALVTITGSGGIGKTRIALQAASDLRRAYADGVWLVDLAPLRAPDLVAHEIAATLGVQQSRERPILETVVEHLEKRQALLVIDNCEHLIGEVAAVLDAILKACPDVRVLATSRERLSIDGERVYRLPSLAVPPAEADLTPAATLEFGSVALFADRAASVSPNFALDEDGAPIVTDICRRLDGIPLAIELAAARADVFGVREIRDRLDERFRILTEGRRTALPRQQTMLATIDWSYDLLGDRERALFRRLGIFAGGFTLEAAVAVGSGEGSDTFDVFDALASLVAKSLVLAEPAGNALRYRLLESTRDYALAKLDASGESGAVARPFAQWCLAFVERAHVRWETVPSELWVTEVKPELENVRGALVWALENRSDVTLGQRIAAGARRLWGRVAPAEGKRWLRTAEEVAEDATPPEITAALWLGDAHVHIALQEYKHALDSAERARRGLSQDREDLAYWEACGFAGCALAMLGRGSEGEPLLVQALAAYKRRGARQLTANALVELAFFNLMRDDAAEARKLFEEALGVFREMGNARGEAAVAFNLAEIEFRAGNSERAIEYGEAALSGSGNDRIPMYLVNMAAYLVAAGRWDEARQRARESISRAAVARTEMETAYALQHFAAVSALRPARDDARAEENRVRAARLIGYADARLAALDCSREFTEQHEYERIVEALKDVLGNDRLGLLHSEGASWTESRALSEAKLI